MVSALLLTIFVVSVLMIGIDYVSRSPVLDELSLDARSRFTIGIVVLFIPLYLLARAGGYRAAALIYAFSSAPAVLVAQELRGLGDPIILYEFIIGTYLFAVIISSGWLWRLLVFNIAWMILTVLIVPNAGWADIVAPVTLHLYSAVIIAVAAGFARQIYNQERTVSQHKHWVWSKWTAHSRDGCFELEPDGSIRLVEGAPLSDWGWTQSKHLGRRFSDFIHSQDSARFEKACRDVRQSRKPVTISVRVSPDAADYREVELVLTRDECSDGCLLIIARDRTSQRMLERLEAREYRLTAQRDLLLDMLPQAAFFINTDAQVVSANRRAVLLFGTAHRDFVGSSIWDWMNQAGEEERALVRLCAEQGTASAPIAALMKPSQGAAFPAEYIITPVHDEIETTQLLVTVIDQREQRVAQQRNELHEQERLMMRALIDHLPYGVFVKDKHSRFTVANRALANWFGVQPHEVVGTSDHRWLPAERAQRFIREDAEIMKSGEPIIERIDEWNDTSGSRSLFRYSKYPLFDAEGRVIGLIGIAVDVTQQILRQEQLGRAERRLRLIINQMPMALVEIDMMGQVVVWNPAAEIIFGYRESEIVGQHIHDLFFPDAVQRQVRYWFRAWNQGLEIAALDQTTPQMSMTSEFERKDGSRIHCEWVLSLLRDERSVVVGMIMTAQNITERRNAEHERLQFLVTQTRLETMRQLVRAISHYFRNYMAQIELARHLIARQIRAGDAQAAVTRLDMIKNGIERLTEQLDNLGTVSAFARPETAPRNLNELVDHAIASVTSMSSTKGIAIQFQQYAENVPVQVDAQQMRDALRHLLSNSITFTPKGGSISVAVEVESDRARIDIIDNGPGMTREQLARAFDLFYRAEDVHTIDTSGLGLGLSIAKLVIEAHGGQVEANSQPGAGTHFKVWLPLAQV